MEKSSLFEDEASEETRELARNRYLRYLAALFLKLLWTSLTAAALVGLLLPLTVVLGWSNFVLSCLLGLLTGISLAAGIVASLQNRTMITLLLGVVILPGLAVYASFLAGSDPRAFAAASSVLTPFLSYALASLIGGLITARIWRNLPVRERAPGAEHEPVQGVPPEIKEHTSYEGSSLNRAA